MVCHDDWTDDGPRAQIVPFQFRIHRAIKQSLRFVRRVAFRRRRALSLRIHQLCGGTHSASTILHATEYSQCANAIAPELAQPTTKDDWNQRVSEENRARHLSWLVRLRRSSHTPS